MKLCQEAATYFFCKVTQTTREHPMYGATKLSWSRCTEGRAFTRHKRTSNSFRAFHESGAAGKIENDKCRGEMYTNTTTVARVNLDDVKKPNLHPVDGDITEDRKLNQGAVKTRFMKSLLAAQ